MCVHMVISCPQALESCRLSKEHSKEALITSIGSRFLFLNSFPPVWVYQLTHELVNPVGVMGGVNTRLRLNARVMPQRRWVEVFVKG